MKKSPFIVMFTLPGQAVANEFGAMHLLVEHSAALCLLPPVQTHRGGKTSIIVKTSPVSCELVLQLLKFECHTGGAAKQSAITEGEIQLMMEEASQIGVVEPIEGKIAGQVLRVGDLYVDDLMVDRTDIHWLDVTDSPMDIQTKIREGGHSRYPVAEGDLDNIIGLVFVKDWVVHLLDSEGPSETEDFYQTIGGFVMSYLGQVPKAGDHFTWQNLTIEVVDMDWRRVDKVLVTLKE